MQTIDWVGSKGECDESHCVSKMQANRQIEIVMIKWAMIINYKQIIRYGCIIGGDLCEWYDTYNMLKWM